MKICLLLFIFLMFISCNNNKSVFWCGDHPCINKKEKQAYFKKTMIVEKKDLKSNSYEDKSEIEKLSQQALLDEKDRIKDERALRKIAKLEEKKRIKEEKALSKQAKLEEKKRIKEEKALSKQAKLEEKKRIKDDKKGFSKKKVTQKSVEKEVSNENIKIKKGNFKELVEKITKQNAFRPYPEINDIPN